MRDRQSEIRESETHRRLSNQSSLKTPQFSQPLRQFFEICSIHFCHELLTVNIMHRQNVIFVEDDLNILIQAVQPSFCQRIIHHTSKMVAIAF